MDKQKSALTISIIALIISIIALLLVLWLGYGCCSQCCKKSHECPQKEEPAAAAVVEKTEAEPAQASMGEEVIVETVKPHEDVVVKEKGGVQYIDLGLPSGTLWANVNDANGLTTYEDAVAKFGKQLPTKKQFTELREKCEWQNLKNGGYKVVGPNGNYITFPLTGFINCTGEFLNANKFGDYWTSTTDGTDEAYRVAFNEKNIIIALHPKCYARAIRLVK